jgi:hypothetical protein
MREWMREDIPSEPKEMDQKTIVKYACYMTRFALLILNCFSPKIECDCKPEYGHLGRECLDVLAESLDRLERYGIIQRRPDTLKVSCDRKQ